MIPPGTQAKLATDYPEGTRHQAKVELAMEMLGNGIPSTVVEDTLAAKFPHSGPQEIAHILRWAMEHNPQPSTGNNGRDQFYHKFNHRPEPQPRPSMRQAKPKKNEMARATQDWLKGKSRCSEYDLLDASAVKVGEFQSHGTLLFESLYAETECVNIVCDFLVNTKGKAQPKGAGKILPACDWCRWFHDRGTPTWTAGAWMRPNPVKEAGSGLLGAITDEDVVAPRFLLLESDSLPFDLQLCALANFRLPVAALLTSGGASVHAWVRLDCVSLEDYTERANTILSLVARFGFDTSNKNPSRLSRLPGAVRKIPIREGVPQRLLYLNPDPGWKSIV